MGARTKMDDAEQHHACAMQIKSADRRGTAGKSSARDPGAAAVHGGNEGGSKAVFQRSRNERYRCGKICRRSETTNPEPQGNLRSSFFDNPELSIQRRRC